MSKVNHIIKKSIFCSLCVIFFCTLGVHAAQLPPDPDNAALLYYQAFLLLPEDNFRLIDPVLYGADPNEKLREYLEDSCETIKLSETASEIPDCSWGIIRSQGQRDYTVVLTIVNKISFLLVADGLTHAFDGDYRTALEKVLSLRRIAQHLADEAVLEYLASMHLHGRAFDYIQQILSSMPLNSDILKWLRGQLSTIGFEPNALARAMEVDLELILQGMRVNHDTLMSIREQLAANVDDENDKNEIFNMTDEELITLAKELYVNFLNSIFQVMDSEMLYKDKYAEIQSLTNTLVEEYINNPATGYIIIQSHALARRIVDWYNIQIRYMAAFDALKIATEIYIVTAETGELPEILPDNLPKDPYSGLDFEYETKQNGFILRCREKDVSNDELREYEFIVAQ